MGRRSDQALIPWASVCAFALVASLCIGAASAQYVLDANPSVYDGTRNAYKPQPAVARDVYSINRSTGTMVYNRSSAFNDSTYSIYERYANDRFSNEKTEGVSWSSDVLRTNRAQQTGDGSAINASANSSGGSASTAATGTPRSSIGESQSVQRVAVNPWNASTPAPNTTGGSMTSSVTSLESRQSTLQPAAYSVSQQREKPHRDRSSEPRKYSVFREREPTQVR